jgi:hypothetical protein
MITKDTICIILAIFVAAFVLYLMIQESRKREMFQMAHLIQILSNGDIMWYPSENQLRHKFMNSNRPYKEIVQSNPAIGNVQPYYIKCNENQQLCTYLKQHQAPSPQFQRVHSYSDWAQQRSTAGVPTPHFNSTW